MALTKCMECGGLISDTAKSCPHCGAPIVKCSECGKILPANAETCPYCGTRQAVTYEEVKLPVKYQEANDKQSVHRNANGGSLTTKIILGAFIIFFIFLITTNPNQDKHERRVRTEISCAVSELRDSMGMSSGLSFIGDYLLDEISKTVLGHSFEVDNYWICSVGKIEFQGKEHIVTIGVANNVFCLFPKDSLKEIVMKWQRSKRNDVTDFFGKIKGFFGFGNFDDSFTNEEENDDNDHHENLLEKLFGGEKEQNI